MKDETCIVAENRNINKSYYLLKIDAPYIAEHAKPGHFVMLKASMSFEPLLKRPLGIFKADPPFIWVYFEVVGKGTELIAALRVNDKVEVLGPLGNGFPAFENKKLLMVAGGRGIAPIYYAIGNYALSNHVFLIYGARTADDLNLLEELNALPLRKIFLYTDDGSKGKKGVVTTDICPIISENKIDATVSCGPDAMFKSLAAEISDMNVENYVSLEALMGCGFGICYSCAVKTVTGEYKKVCIDGPVFNMREIAW
jgi:dihydroorotate dehydrogenase electron transfer subunit